MQRTISTLGLAIVLPLAVDVCQRASAQVSTQEGNQTERAPKNSVEPVYSVVSPLGDPVVKVVTMALRLDTLNGKTVCLVWNEAFKAEIILPAIGQSLKDAHPYIKIIPYTEIDAATQAAGRENPSAEEAAILRTVLPSANLRATPWNIAANEVMAGCRPEHLPVLIAAVKAMGNPAFRLSMSGASTHSFVHFYLVNGPLARQLRIDHGQGLIAHPTNQVIGRALGFIEGHP